jgi:hypothetical protein
MGPQVCWCCAGRACDVKFCSKPLHSFEGEPSNPCLTWKICTSILAGRDRDVKPMMKMMMRIKQERTRDRNKSKQNIKQMI